MGGKLILIRHGQSMWNAQNLFTGWVDVPLSQKGIEEALKAGEIISHIPLDVIYVSSLIRAQMTAMLAMSNHDEALTPYFVHEGDSEHKKMGAIESEETKKHLVPVVISSKLNERMYGKLQGLNKEAVKKEFGEQQFKLWRRSYDTPPPEGESLKMTKDRAYPYFEKEIYPRVVAGENVLVSAHGNSLRAIIMMLENISEDKIVQLEIPTGVPICYEYVDNVLKKIEL